MSGAEYLNLVILALFIAGATGYAFWLSKRADITTVPSLQSEGGEGKIATPLAGISEMTADFRGKPELAGDGDISTGTYEVSKTRVARGISLERVGQGGVFREVGLGKARRLTTAKARHAKDKKTPNSA